jgi:hypothetical protein
VAGGALVEVPTVEVVIEDVLDAISAWLTENPEAQATAGGISKRLGVDNRSLYGYVVKKFNAATAREIGDAICLGLRQKSLIEVEIKRSNRGKKTVLRLGKRQSERNENNDVAQDVF